MALPPLDQPRLTLDDAAAMGGRDMRVHGDEYRHEVQFCGQFGTKIYVRKSGVWLGTALVPELRTVESLQSLLDALGFRAPAAKPPR